MDFSEALKLMKEGNTLFRRGWNGVQAGITMFVYKASKATMPNELSLSEMGIVVLDPFLVFYHSKNDTHNFWVPSIWDLMAEDWEIFER